MKSYMVERGKLFAAYMLKHQCTIRQVAKAFNVSKSTVHKDVAERLEQNDQMLYKQVKTLLVKNKAERHMRGGLATKKKFLEQRMVKA